MIAAICISGKHFGVLCRVQLSVSGLVRLSVRPIGYLSTAIKEPIFYLLLIRQIRTLPVTKQLTDEVLRPFLAAMEQVVRDTIRDELAANRPPLLPSDSGI